LKKRPAGQTTPAAIGFAGPARFRAWLERYHDSETERLVRCFKNHARAKGLTYFEAVDEALCFGWIDGVRRALDEDSFTVRFTPRKVRSFWSAVNVKRVKALAAEGRLRPPGLAAFGRRSLGPKRRYSYESRPRALAPPYFRKLRANSRARAYYEAAAPWYRRTTAFWVMSAAKEETRARRLAILIAASAKGLPIPLLDRRPGSSGKARR